jgi:FkbM family methyltransferase
MLRRIWPIIIALRSNVSYPISKTRRIATYCRLCAKHALARLSLIRPSKERLFGYTLTLGDYASFIVMYEEIFLALEYYFTSSTPAPLIIDAGSNIGLAALFFSIMYPQSQIICFEPGERSYHCLAENVRGNMLDGVTTHRVALDAASDRQVQLFSTVETSLMASVRRERKESAATAETVRTATLSSHITGAVELLKLDIEGNEHSVAEDLTAHGSWQHVQQAIIEYHHHVSTGDDRLAEFLARLQEAGFRYQIHTTYRPPFMKDRFQNIMIYAYR